MSTWAFVSWMGYYASEGGLFVKLSFKSTLETSTKWGQNIHSLSPIGPG